MILSMAVITVKRGRTSVTGAVILNVSNSLFDGHAGKCITGQTDYISLKEHKKDSRL